LGQALYNSPPETADLGTKHQSGRHLVLGRGKPEQLVLGGSVRYGKRVGAEQHTAVQNRRAERGDRPVQLQEEIRGQHRGGTDGHVDTENQVSFGEQEAASVRRGHGLAVAPSHELAEDSPATLRQCIAGGHEVVEPRGRGAR